MNAQDILTMKPKDASILFPGDADAVKKGYRKLAKLWHPDKNTDALAEEVFSHLTVLKDAALRGSSGTTSSLLQSKTFLREGHGAKGGYRFRYLVEHEADLGSVWVGRTSLAYDFPDSFDDLAVCERERLMSFKFADAAMEKEIERFLPKQKAFWDLGHNGLVSVIERPEGYVLLADLWSHYNGKIPAVHVAWIVSSLLNVACYLKWAGLCHGAISMNNVLVSPKGHSIILAGGWGFATKFGERPAALPTATTSRVPSLEIPGSTVNDKVDLRLIRDLAIDLLASFGRMTEDVPQPMRMWLLLPPKEHAYADYASWVDCLEKSFGKRKFVEMNVTAADIYGE